MFSGTYYPHLSLNPSPLLWSHRCWCWRDLQIFSICLSWTFRTLSSCPPSTETPHAMQLHKLEKDRATQSLSQRKNTFANHSYFLQKQFYKLGQLAIYKTARLSQHFQKIFSWKFVVMWYSDPNPRTVVLNLDKFQSTCLHYNLYTDGPCIQTAPERITVRDTGPGSAWVYLFSIISLMAFAGLCTTCSTERYSLLAPAHVCTYLSCSDFIDNGFVQPLNFLRDVATGCWKSWTPRRHCSTRSYRTASLQQAKGKGRFFAN